MKKGLVIFAAASMMAAGVSIAANVSFGQRMATMFSNAFEFVGPVSGLVHALVKPKEDPKTPIIPSFEDKLNTPGAVPDVPPLPAKGSRLQGDAHLNVSANEVAGAAPQDARHTLEEAARIPQASASALSLHALNQDGSIAKAIVDSGDGAALASLGNSLQTKQPEFAAALPQDVWASLLNKPALASAEPVKMALNTVITNKQIEAGTAIAGTITTQAQSASAAGIYAQSAAIAGSNAATGNGTTANQITAGSLTRVNGPVQLGGTVPAPGSIGLLLAGLLVLGVTFTGKHSKGRH